MKRVLDLLRSNSDPSPKMEILREKMKCLTAREADIRTELDNAEIQPGKRRREEVVHWLTNVEVKKSDVQSIVKETQQQGFISSNSLLSGRIDSVTKDVRELIQQSGFPNGLVLDDHKSRALPFPVTGLVGEMFQQHFKTIPGWLEDPKSLLIGVHGMGGVGKTTLLKHLYNHVLENTDIACHVYWVTVSQDCSLYMLQHKIAHSVTGMKDLDEEDEERRAAVLHNILGKMGKTLLILDDLWEPFMLDKVGIPHGGNRCKIVLSTRSLEVCRRMGCEGFVIRVTPLSINEALKLFVDKLQNYEALGPEVKQIATLVAKECGCLPLAIITIAVSMRGVSNMPEWLDALDELKNPSRREHCGEHEIFSKLKFSYDRLSDEITQRCFLSCVLYPEDSEIERKELIDLWIAEGFLNRMKTRCEQLNKGHTILNKLENACLLDPVAGGFDERCVKMHDLIRDMGIIISQSHSHYMVRPGLLLKEMPEEVNWTKDLVKVSLRENVITEIPYDMSPKCSKLSVMMLCRNPLKGIPESFFIQMTALTVLDLSYTDIIRLPDSVCNLENLRALFLKGCEELVYVPSLAKLTNLTMLDLGYAGKIKEAPRGMEKLKCLQKVDCTWNLSDDSDLTYFHRLGEYRQFSELSCYVFWLCAEPDYVGSDWFEGHRENFNYEKKVMISGGEFGQGTSTPLLPETIQCLAIMNRHIKGRESALGDVLPSLGSATELRSLDISLCKGLKYIWSTTLDVFSIFPQLDILECLDLYKLPDLRGLIQFCGGSETILPSRSPQSAGNFSHLKKLSIQECHKLKAVFPLRLLQQQPFLPKLEYIQVMMCEEVEEIFESPISSDFQTGNEPHNINIINIILTLPNLRSLCMMYLPKLQSIYRGLLCAPLKTYSSTDCPQFGRIHRGPCLMWDDYLSTLASVHNNSDWWEPLCRDYPNDACVLSSWMNNTRDDRLIRSWVDWLDGVQPYGYDDGGGSGDNCDDHESSAGLYNIQLPGNKSRTGS